MFWAKLARATARSAAQYFNDIKQTTMNPVINDHLAERLKSRRPPVKSVMRGIILCEADVVGTLKNLMYPLLPPLSMALQQLPIALVMVSKLTHPATLQALKIAVLPEIVCSRRLNPYTTG
ncbi:hypothetical protein HDU90_001610 [Geranomyces variabilis]|nr:hypothetical protein HDU90_001610 [Geranomyces variabilis]